MKCLVENEDARRFELRKLRAIERKRLDRELLSIVKEHYRLWEAKWSAPLVKLETPYQKGWERFFVLSSKARHRRDVEKLEELLGFLNTRQRCMRRDFMVRQGKSKKLVPMNLGLSRYHVATLLRMKVPDRLFPYLENFKRQKLVNRVEAERLRRMNYPWKFGVCDEAWFEVVVEPFWITHRRVVMPEVESRLAELREFLERRGGWDRYMYLKGKSWRRYNQFEIRLDERRMRELEKEWRDPQWILENIRDEEGVDGSAPFSFPVFIEALGPIVRFPIFQASSRRGLQVFSEYGFLG